MYREFFIFALLSTITTTCSSYQYKMTDPFCKSQTDKGYDLEYLLLHEKNCKVQCPPGYSNTGLFCHKWWPPHSITPTCNKDECQWEYTKCAPQCPDGYLYDVEKKNCYFSLWAPCVMDVQV